jgi:alpha-tubulin suppressor-like RCC1 family protein
MAVRLFHACLLAFSLACGRTTPLQGRGCPCAEDYVCCQSRCVLGRTCPNPEATTDSGARDLTDSATTVESGADSNLADHRDSANDSEGAVHDGDDHLDGPPMLYTAISAGPFHTCVLRDNGSVGCWGTEVSQVAPPDGRFSQVSSGRYHACALGADGAIRCWGECTMGGRLCAVPPVGIFKSLSNSFDHTCAVAWDGEVSCWGVAGQTPPPRKFEQVAVGSDFSCGLSGTAVVCWGPRAKGMQIPALSYTAVAAASDWACGLTTQGTVSCWGSPPSAPRSPPGASHAALAIGSSSGCTIDSSGTLGCWAKMDATITLPSSSLAFRSISMGGDTLCGVTIDGRLSCLGPSAPGRGPPLGPVSDFAAGPGVCWLGEGHRVECSSLSPPAEQLVRLSADRDVVCGIAENGDLLCWGSEVPVSHANGPFHEAAVGYHHACALRFDGTVGCWGDPTLAKAPSGTFKTIAAAGVHTCALATDGLMSCWGPDGEIQTIPGTFVAIATGQEGTCGIQKGGGLTCTSPYGLGLVPPGSFTQVAIGTNHACGLRDGPPVCWGDGLAEWMKPPAGPFTKIGISASTSCGLRPEGTLVCWGALHWPDEPRPTP